MIFKDSHINMHNGIYRTISVGWAKSIAEQITRKMSTRQLEDIDYKRYDIVQNNEDNVTK